MILKIQLPESAQLIPKTGDKITIGDFLYSTHSGKNISINVCDRLKIQPSKIFQVMQVVVGDVVQKNEIIALKKTFLSAKKVKSSITGTVRHIRHSSGEVVISKNIQGNKKVKSFFSGTIQKYDSALRILSISFTNGKEFSISNCTENSGGSMFVYHDDSQYFTVDQDQVQGSIIIIERLRSHVKTKLETLGVKGFLYQRGSSSHDAPSAKIQKKSDLDMLSSKKFTYVIFSTFEKKGIAYNIKKRS